MTYSKQELRAEIKQKRRELSLVTQNSFSQKIVHQLLALPIFQKSHKIAIYLSIDNEVDISSLFRLAPKKRYFLPIISRNMSLAFSGYNLGQGLELNRLNVPEPAEKTYAPASELDLVCVPLVGFSERGHRLGSGGGFYDRTFAFKKDSNAPPHLLGIAYECQKVKEWTTEPWDIPLWGIQTEEQLYLGD